MNSHVHMPLFFLVNDWATLEAMSGPYYVASQFSHSVIYRNSRLFIRKTSFKSLDSSEAIFDLVQIYMLQGYERSEALSTAACNGIKIFYCFA